MDALTILLCDLSQFSTALLMFVFVIITFTSREVMFIFQASIISMISYTSTVFHRRYTYDPTLSICSTVDGSSFFSSEISNLATYFAIIAYVLLYSGLWGTFKSYFPQKLAVVGYMIAISAITIYLRHGEVGSIFLYIIYGSVGGSAFMIIMYFYVLRMVPKSKMETFGQMMGLKDTYLYYLPPPIPKDPLDEYSD